MMAVVLTAGRCAAQTCDYTVTSLADSGTGTLRAGLADATVTDICFGVQGTIVLASTLQITTPVTINGSGITVSGNNQFGLLSVSLPGIGAVAAASKGARGARVRAVPNYVGGPTVAINGMTFTGGNGANGGGAISNASGNLVLTGTTFGNNTATNGGAIYNSDSVTLSQCTFAGNTSSSGTGGAFYNSGTLLIQGGTFTSNASPNGAGVLYNNGPAQVTGAVLFSGNTGSEGGAIYNDFYGTLTISGGPTFTQNSATISGGAIMNVGTATIVQALFSKNSAQAAPGAAATGGAVYDTGAATISESTVTGNTSSQNGGGIGFGAGTLTLVNDTITANTAGLSGSGVDMETEVIPTISNSILANNTPIGGVNADCGNCATVNGSNNIIGQNPYLGPLAQNGGPTQTMMPLPGGPAVGGGNSQLTIDAIDQRGFSRAAASGAVDVGAVQSHYSAVTFSTQPSNTYLNTVILPAVSVQVLEVDGTTNNYPLGVPVTVSLFTSQGVQDASSLAGTLTQQPSVVSGQTAAVFSDLSVSAGGSYELQATIVATPSSASQDPAYGATSNVFQVSVVTLAWQPAPLTYGPMPVRELNAVATIDGQTSTGTFIYTFTNGGATINVGQVYPVGTYGVLVAYAPPGFTGNPYLVQTAMQINPATPALSWPTPTPIYTATPLSATQLDATATGATGAPLPGSFVYTPPAGTTLSAGAHTLAVAFTPTDATDYTAATTQVTIQVGYMPMSIVSISPSTLSLSSSPVSISIMGSGFMTSSVVELNGAPIATTFQSATALTAILPAANLADPGTLNISAYDSVSKLTSNVIQLPVSAQTANISFTIPQVSGSGEQATIDLGVNSPYAADLTGTLGLSFAPSGSGGVDDPAIQFSTGGRTLTFTIPAGSTSAPQVGLQTGTVAGTISVTLSLVAGGVDVTPAGVSPITLVIAPAAPVITNLTFTSDSSGLITVAMTGFSNTREATQAEFVFTGAGATALSSPKVDIPVSSLFSPWYSSTDSDQYGSEFTYTQQFQLSSPGAAITGVSATLTNSVGTSESVNSQ